MPVKVRERIGPALASPGFVLDAHSGGMARRSRRDDPIQVTGLTFPSYQYTNFGMVLQRAMQSRRSSDRLRHAPKCRCSSRWDLCDGWNLQGIGLNGGGRTYPSQ